jgi:hypothetical protein
MLRVCLQLRHLPIINPEQQLAITRTGKLRNAARVAACRAQGVAPESCAMAWADGSSRGLPGVTTRGLDRGGVVFLSTQAARSRSVSPFHRAVF